MAESRKAMVRRRPAPDRQATAKKRVASRKPRICVAPKGIVSSDADDICILCECYWMRPDEWQRDVLRVWRGRDKDGRLLVLSAGISCPRQNGKNGCIEFLEFYLLVTDGDTHILHTAHSTKTAQKAFERMVKVFTGKVPGKQRAGRALMKMVSKQAGGRIRYTNGEWAIYLSNGASIEYCTRTNAGGRGFDGISLLVYDECQQLTDEHVQAVMSTLAASKSGQMIIYAGTPPNATAAGEVFERRRTTCITKPDEHSSWHEWSIDHMPADGVTFDELLDDVYATNPAMEIGRPGCLNLTFTKQEFIDMDLAGFCRERLGYWQEGTVINPVLDGTSWSRCVCRTPSQATTHIKQCIGIKFSQDGSYMSVAVATVVRGDTPHVELIEHSNISGTGVGPIAERLYRARKKLSLVMIDGQSNADALITRLQELKYPKTGYVRVSPRELVSATSTLVDRVRSGTVTHYDQQALNQSALTSTKRSVGGGGGYGFGGISPEPLEASALALYAVITSRRNPARRMRIGGGTRRRAMSPR